MTRERDQRDFSFIAPRGVAAVYREVSAALPGAHEIAVRRIHSFTGSPATVVSTGAVAEAGDSLAERARAHLAAIAPALGEGPLEFVADPVVHRTSGGAQVVHLHQHHRGIPVFEAVRTVRFDPAGAVQEVTGDSVPVAAEVDLRPALTAPEATLAAARHLAAEDQGEAPAPLKVPRSLPRVIASFPLACRPTVLRKRPFAEGITAQLVVFHRGPDAVLGWLVALIVAATGEAYDVVVGANGADAGEILYCRATTDSARARGRAYRSNPGAGEREWLDFPQPLDVYPPPGPTALPAAFPGPWVSRRNTSGNNAACYRGNRRKGLKGQPAAGTVTFDPADPEGEDQRLLNAFYFCNYLHDFFYLLGFDEEEGNFQQRNFTGAKGDEDELEVRIFPGFVTGDARIRTRRDGKSCQLYLGRHEATGRHTALDADLVFHELAHGLTNRMIGGGQVWDPLRQPQSRALGEGWSDYFALTIQSYRKPEEKVIFGAWLGNKREGLRRWPYDDDYPLTFGDLLAPENQEPHAAGELWCATLMAMNREIGRLLRAAERGHEVGWQLVMDSLKLLPVGTNLPGFLDARDAIYQALADLTGWEADAQTRLRATVRAVFARFGMGKGAHSNGAQFAGIVESRTV